MRLKRLELQGFKSFLDRTVLTFQPGITGVVGPNGCGKSNIVDAIQWVMGEQSAKHLRGDSMTDVIFNGSDSKAATSMAEVSLILDRQGVALAPQFAAFDKADEIAITRRVYRDGTSEYCINKTQCRLKDIHELFMDTGVGKRAYSIIEQGQIDRMISVKPEERRGLFEEVAGITKYKAKRKEAEKKLEGTRQNLTRLQDIINELEKQIRSLKVQATRARKYKELKSELESVDLYLLGRNAYTHAKQVTELEQRKEVLVNERSQTDASYGQFEANILDLDVKRIDQEKSVQDLGNQERNLALTLQKLESEALLLEERRKNLLEALNRKKKEESETADALEALKNDLSADQTNLDDLISNLENLETDLAQAEVRVRDLNQNRQADQMKKMELESQQTKIEHRKVAIENQEHSLAARQGEVEELIGQLSQKKTELDIVIDSQRTAVSDADQRILQMTERASSAEQEVALIHTDCQKTSSDLSLMEKDLYAAREEFHSQRSRLQSLQELQSNLEGYSAPARDLLLALGEEKGTAIPLAEVLTPDADVEESIETLLGSDMNTILVQTPEEAERLSRLVTTRGLERVRLVAISEIREKAFPSIESIDQVMPLLQKIRVAPEYESVAQWWFGKVYITQDLGQVFHLRQQYPHLTFICPEGQTVGHFDRSVSSGKTPTKMGVFARRREIEDLALKCEGLNSHLTKLNSDRENLLQYLQNQEKLHSDLKEKLSVIHIESVEARKEREKLHFELSRLEREAGTLVHEIERQTTIQADTKERLKALTDEMITLAGEGDRLKKDLEDLSNHIESREKESQELVQALGDKKIERSTLCERKNGLENKIHKIELEVEDSSSS